MSAVVGGASGASAVAIDARDVWLDAIADGALLLDATDAVRESFLMLAAGLDAHGLVNGDQITPHHGLVPEAGPELDPTTHPDREISPSSLEKLAACPLSWFYRYGLALHPPDDPEYDAERWLTDLDRGSLLHEVFETFAKEFAERQDELEGDGARARILAIADETIARWREDVPPPGEVVFEAEAQDLRRDALAFLEMERALRASGDSGRWLAFELAFGSGSPVGTFALPDGRTLAVRGKADRVDELPDGTLRVVDYKTGRSGRFARGGKKAPFNGGRQLQPALYAAAVETLLDGKEVSRFEYRFPTEKGENEVVTYGADELEAARGLVGELLDHVRRGEFVPTTERADCSWCDYKAVCRASKGDWGTRSPLAEWAEEKAPNLAVYVPMLARRAPKGNDA